MSRRVRSSERRRIDLGLRLGSAPSAAAAAARARHPSAQAPVGAPTRLRRGSRAGRALTYIIDRAGDPPGASPERLAAHIIVSACLAGAVAAAVILSMHGAAAAPLPALVAATALATALGAALPVLPLVRRARTRSRRIAADLPDALDLLALATSAGLALDAAVARVSAACAGPLGDELRRWQQDVSLGVPRARALRDLARRSAVPDLNALAAAVGQADTAGSSLAEAVRSQAAVQRLHRALRAEERAQRLPVQLVFPLVLCVLPALLVVIVGPAVVSFSSGGALP